MKGTIVSKKITNNQLRQGMQVMVDDGFVYRVMHISGAQSHQREVMLRGDRKTSRYLSECNILAIEYIVSPDNGDYRLSELRYDEVQQLYYAHILFDETDWAVIILRNFVNSNKIVEFEIQEDIFPRKANIVTIEQETFTLEQLEQAFKAGLSGVWDDFQDWRDNELKYEQLKKAQA